MVNYLIFFQCNKQDPYNRVNKRIFLEGMWSVIKYFLMMYVWKGRSEASNPSLDLSERFPQKLTVGQDSAERWLENSYSHYF